MTKYEQKRVEHAETRSPLTHTGSFCLAFILSILTFPTFSETLGNSPQCDNSTLHTTTGPATLNARWSANTIILNWNAGNDATFTAPVQGSAAYSCEYDGGITLPTAPTRSGYTFGGWRVVDDVCADPASPSCCAITDNEDPGCSDYCNTAAGENDYEHCPSEYCDANPADYEHCEYDAPDPCSIDPVGNECCEIMGHSDPACPMYCEYNPDSPECCTDEWNPACPNFIGPGEMEEP